MKTLTHCEGHETPSASQDIGWFNTKALKKAIKVLNEAEPLKDTEACCDAQVFGKEDHTVDCSPKEPDNLFDTDRDAYFKDKFKTEAEKIIDSPILARYHTLNKALEAKQKAVDALYQLHLGGVREVIGSDEDVNGEIEKMVEKAKELAFAVQELQVNFKLLTDYVRAIDKELMQELGEKAAEAYLTNTDGKE